jgi:phosphoglycerate dehydrogenase-like enzyme
MLVYVAEKNEIHPKAIKLLKDNGHKVLFSLKNEDYRKIEAVFIRTYTKLDKKFFSSFVNLKYILRAGVGVDNIDTDETQKRNIKIITSPGSNADSVAEFVVGLIIFLIKNINEQSARLYKGQWRDKDLMGDDLNGKILGLVGCGAVGKLVVKKLQGFNIKLLGYDPYLDNATLKGYGIEKVTLLDLIKKSDIISLHLPLTPETVNLFTLKEFEKMKKNVILINTSRGKLVNEEDLIQALNKNIIAKAAVDVFENEPMINKKLLHAKNLFLTPHIAAFTTNSDLNMSLQAVQNFLKLTMIE